MSFWVWFDIGLLALAIYLTIQHFKEKAARERAEIELIIARMRLEELQDKDERRKSTFYN